MTTPLHKEPFHITIRFKADYSATLIMGRDRKSGVMQEQDETFPAGEHYDVVLFDDQGEYVSLKFKTGGELYGLKKELFDVVKV